PDAIIAFGPKPNLPNILMKRILPNIPEIVFPVSPKEYFFLKAPNMLALISPIKMLNREIKVSVIILF
ncbi:MAG TPA: hypothetical protein VK050_11940, partial [Flavobacteriaceae bacterium]|nr:hypothetical protein [Flavobacteriaceae bacterium]